MPLLLQPWMSSVNFPQMSLYPSYRLRLRQRPKQNLTAATCSDPIRPPFPFFPLAISITTFYLAQKTLRPLQGLCFWELVHPGNLSIYTHRLAPLVGNLISSRLVVRKPTQVTDCSAPRHGESEFRAGSRLLLLCSPSQSTTTVCLFARDWAVVCFWRHRSLAHRVVCKCRGKCR